MFSFGEKIKIQIFGQSHSDSLGVVIDGLPAGEKIDMDALSEFLQRRAPGRNEHSTMRKEPDAPEFISGLVDGKTCGAPICAVIHNKDTRSGDYAKIADIPRPGHSDYPAFVKYGGHNDIRGGGQFSARLTAALCIAGGIIGQLLEKRGIYAGAHVLEIHGVRDENFDPVSVDKEILKDVGAKDFPVINDEKGKLMRREILSAQEKKDSVGGIVELAVVGLPVGLGSHMFGGIENRIAAAMFAVPALKGIEFGAGFSVASLYGSENNDSYFYDNDGNVKTRTNNSGGVLGGMTTGMPLLLRAAFKPTPSIAAKQESVSLSGRIGAELEIVGRHDPCVVPRTVPCVEAAALIALGDMIL